MIQLVIIAVVLGLSASASLDNTYLPPNQGPFSNTAFGGSSSAPALAQAYSSNNFNQASASAFAADNNGEGFYRYNYQAGNSISAQEEGDARGDGTKAHGSYSFTLPNGEHVSVTYTADENGFVAQGSHIPTPPPVPEAILKALQENAAAEARGLFDDGAYHGEGLNEGEYHGEGEGAGSYSESRAANYGSSGGYKY